MATKVLAALALATQELQLVDNINSAPGVTWKAEVNGMEKASFKKLLGVHVGKSWDAVQKLPRAVSSIRDEDIPASFDSETNWPQCAKVIGDIRDQSMYVSVFNNVVFFFLGAADTKK